jgi:hypothetical protein
MKYLLRYGELYTLLTNANGRCNRVYPKPITRLKKRLVYNSEGLIFSLLSIVYRRSFCVVLGQCVTTSVLSKYNTHDIPSSILLHFVIISIEGHFMSCKCLFTASFTFIR